LKNFINLFFNDIEIHIAQIYIILFYVSHYPSYLLAIRSDRILSKLYTLYTLLDFFSVAVREKVFCLTTLAEHRTVHGSFFVCVSPHHLLLDVTTAKGPISSTRRSLFSLSTYAHRDAPFICVTDLLLLRLCMHKGKKKIISSKSYFWQQLVSGNSDGKIYHLCTQKFSGSELPISGRGISS